MEPGLAFFRGMGEAFHRCGMASMGGEAQLEQEHLDIFTRHLMDRA
jgi:hypothetical protein